MKKNYLALLLTLLFCLPLAACQGSGAEATGTWTETDETPGRFMEAVGYGIRPVPFDEEAFQAASDRAEMTDKGSLALKDACGITIEKATLDGKTVLKPTGDDMGILTVLTPDGTTLITRGKSSLWITTAEGTQKYTDYCRGEVLVTSDGTGFVYDSGKAERDNENRQLYLYDLTTGQETALTEDAEYNYCASDWLNEETVLCTRNPKNDFTQFELAAVALDGTVTVLDAKIDGYTTLESSNNYIFMAENTESLLADGINVMEYDGTEKLIPVYNFQNMMVTGMQKSFLSPDGGKLALVWATDVPSENWKVKVVDLTTGGDLDMDLPEPFGETVLRVAEWKDENTLLVTAWDGYGEESPVGAWNVALPDEIGEN